MRKWLFRWFIILNFILAGILGLSYLAKYISPSLSIVVAFAGMAYSYLLSAFLLWTIVLLLIQKYKYVVVNLLIMALGWHHLSGWIQFNSNTEDPTSFRVMSYNVKLFDLYNWKNNQKSKRAILNNIKSQNPDIISFQEFYYDNKTFQIDTICHYLDMPYYYVTDSKFLHGFEHFGQAIFSKFPIKNSELIPFPSTTNMSLYCDIEVKKGKLIRVFSNHLESYRFQEEDYDLISDIKDQETYLEKVPGLFGRLERAMVKRSYQAEKMASVVNASPYPVVVTGDFNDTPNSYTYFQISRYLNDAFTESGWGFSNTYKGSFPSFRIDFILYSSELQSINYQRKLFPSSDHYPIFTDFVFSKQK